MFAISRSIGSESLTYLDDPTDLKREGNPMSTIVSRPNSSLVAAQTPDTFTRTEGRDLARRECPINGGSGLASVS